MAQWAKNLPAAQETQIESLGQENPGGGNSNPSSTLALNSCGQRSLVGLSPWVPKEMDMDEYSEERER